MKKTEINAVTKNVPGFFKKVGLGLRKHSPEIFMAVGVVGVVAGAVLAIKATPKALEIVDKYKSDDAQFRDLAANAGVEEYTDEDCLKDRVVIATQTAVKVAAIYAPAAAVGAASLGLIIASNNILRNRNTSLAAAYAAISAGFKAYRKRVSERFGDETERELRYNVVHTTVDSVIFDKDGEEQHIEEPVALAGKIDGYSDYARFFDDGCAGWEKNAEFNLMFLKARQNIANDKLKANGILFLNEVYDLLGIPRTKAGQIVGWVYNPEEPVGDNYVDFGIYDAFKTKARDFVNGYERAILLDFNVDGNVWDLM